MDNIDENVLLVFLEDKLNRLKTKTMSEREKHVFFLISDIYRDFTKREKNENINNDENINNCENEDEKNAIKYVFLGKYIYSLINKV